jgi:SRSO17 transposase
MGLITLPIGSNMSKMATYIPGSGSCRTLSNFISNSNWDSDSVMHNTRELAVKLLGPGGCYVLDESGRRTYGSALVASFYQYIGRLGNKCLGQVEVFASYCNNNEALIVDFRLFTSEKWLDKIDKVFKTKVPPDCQFHKTKPQLALEMLDQAIKEEIPFNCVLTDGLYGNDSKFINGLYDRNLPFICDIPKNTLVYIIEPLQKIPEKTGNLGRKRTIFEVFNTCTTPVSWISDKQVEWDTVDVRIIDRGIKTIKCASLMVWRRHDKKPVQTPLRLLMINDPDDDDIRYSLTNLIDMDNSQLGILHSNRYWIERNFEDAKGLCNLSSFMGRSWLSLHHHICLVAIALLYLLTLKKAFEKRSIYLSLNQIAAIVLHKYPIKKLKCQELVDLINQINELRAKQWLYRTIKWMKQRLENMEKWNTKLLDNRSIIG